MEVKIKLFAAARQTCGQEEVAVEVQSGATVGDLKQSLITAFPNLRTILPTSMVAIDHDYADDSRKIDSHVEIALIPPVSGG